MGYIAARSTGWMKAVRINDRSNRTIKNARNVGGLECRPCLPRVSVIAMRSRQYNRPWECKFRPLDEEYEGC
jgi:hypothetical protein